MSSFFCILEEDFLLFSRSISFFGGEKVGSYKNIYRVDKYTKRVELLKSGVKNLSANSFFKDIEGTLEREIAEPKGKTWAFLFYGDTAT